MLYNLLLLIILLHLNKMLLEIQALFVQAIVLIEIVNFLLFSSLFISLFILPGHPVKGILIVAFFFAILALTASSS